MILLFEAPSLMGEICCFRALSLMETWPCRATSNLRGGTDQPLEAPSL